MNYFIRLTLTTILIGVQALVFAQSGKIIATVYDDETGEPLIGANVVINETTTGNVTDLDGKAVIGNINSGTYDLKVSYVSYQTKIIKDVEVNVGKTTTIDVRLPSESIGLEEIVVTAEAERSSENALLTVQKKSPKVLDAISSDQFSRFGDNDAASAVKRVTGVTVESGKYVYVRGLGDRYSKAVLNGADMPGLDPNRNSVQLDLFPSNLIDNIIVYKTFSPDLTGEFTGGLVNVETKDFPDRFTMQISASAGYNTQATFNNAYTTYQGSETDWLGFDGGIRELPSYLEPFTQSNFPSPARINLENVNQETITKASRAFDNRQFATETMAPPVNHSFSFSIGNQTTFLGKQLGFLGGITYNRDYDFYSNGRVNRYEPLTTSATTLNDDVLYSVRDVQSNDAVTIGAILNTSLKFNNNHKVGLNLMHNQSGTDITRYQEGYRLDNTQDSTNLLQNRVLNYRQRGLSTAQLKGEHILEGLNKIEIDWFSSYTYSTMEEPDLRFFLNNIFLDSPGGDTVSYRMSNRSRPGRYYRDMTEVNFDNQLDFTIPVKLFSDLDGKIKFGGKFTSRDREFNEDRYEYFLDFINYDGDVGVFFQDENLGYNSEGDLRNYLELFTQEPNNYTASQSIYAGYLMVETPIVEKLKMTAGVRFERTEMNIETSQINEGFETNDPLPALSFTYALDDNTNLRTAYGRTLARPTFREFAPLVTFAFYGEFDQIGNPNLERTLIDNFDLRWETYPKNGEYIGASLFYKRFKNPIINTINPQAGGSTQEYKYENVENAFLTGAEFEIRKHLDFIAPFLANFKAGINASYIYSRVDLESDELSTLRAFDPDAEDWRTMYNQSPYIINANLRYDNLNSGWSSNVTFNVFGERLQYFQTNLPFVLEQPRPELNLTVKKTFANNLSVRLRANNLLNPYYDMTMDLNDKEFIFNRYTQGRDFSISFSYIIE